jgi:hypothetical protein
VVCFHVPFWQAVPPHLLQLAYQYTRLRAARTSYTILRYLVKQ